MADNFLGESEVGDGIGSSDKNNINDIVGNIQGGASKYIENPIKDASGVPVGVDLDITPTTNEIIATKEINGTSIGDQLSSVINSIQSGDILNQVTDSIGDLISSITDTVTDTVGSIKDSIKTVIGGIGSVVDTVKNSKFSEITSITDAAQSIFKKFPLFNINDVIAQVNNQQTSFDFDDGRDNFLKDSKAKYQAKGTELNLENKTTKSEAVALSKDSKTGEVTNSEDTETFVQETNEGKTPVIESDVVAEAEAEEQVVTEAVKRARDEDPVQAKIDETMYA